MTSRHAPDTLPPPRRRLRQAACAAEGIDPDVMFPPRSNAALVAEARAVCASCPVRPACLAWALDHPRDAAYGVWGGLTEAERAAVLRRRQPRDPDHPRPPRTGGRPRAACGTPAAYDRHVRHHERIDDACREAKRRHDAAYRARTTAGAS
ncbi:WhiB family transcriptional regulator [Streptomyces boncukensis]|uniref:Transcriptional regulator WhiB n=1 Tax=Streptomyces boncukensis TaxID=2711219 RepID=A0A6G4WVX2_9ACTN|nr:WhiB family transcriptional regulator [Streptomyces boncukensis]